MELRGPFLASVLGVRPLSLAPLALLAASSLVGCASAASSVDSDSAPTTVEGVIHVDQSTSILETGADVTTTSVSAKFLRVLPEDAARAMSLVGSRVVVPHEGECAPLASLAPQPLDVARLDRARKNAFLKGQVDLVDVGDLVLRASAPKPASKVLAPSAKDSDPLEVRLTPRAFPDVGDLVSGVFYTQPDVAVTPAAELPSPGSYVLTGSGAALVEPFAINVDAPATPANVRLGGQPFATQKGANAATAGRDLAIEWDAVETEGLVYVDVQGATPTRCAFKDTGSAILPADVLSRDDAGHTVAVSLHRVREESVHIEPSAKQATVRFDFSRSGRVVVE